jgi:hypothetical protein
LEFSLSPERVNYTSGEPVRLKATICYVSKEVIKIKDTPRFSVFSLMAAEPESNPISPFGYQTLKSGETVTKEITWQQKVQPGWYQTSLTLDIQTDDNDNVTRLSGGGGRFFVTDLDPALGEQQGDSKDGGIDGFAVFNPTTIDVRDIRIKITEWSVVQKGNGVITFQGPWQVKIPIKNNNIR